MSALTGRQILVIGANGAFGLAFCEQLGVQGAEVIGTARTNESSVRLKTHLAQRLLMDLSDPGSISTLTNYLLATNTQIDGIVLASGLVAFGAAATTPASILQQLMHVNALGQIQLVQELLPALEASATQGRTPFVASISGVISEKPMPGLSAYSASKTAIHGYSLAASREFQKIGIRWLDARPGHTESGLAGRAIYGTAPNFGAGMAVDHVVARIIKAVLEDEKDVPSGSF